MTFSELGGPFKRGLIVVSDDTREVWRVVAEFDLDESSDVAVSISAGMGQRVFELDEMTCLEAWHGARTKGHQLFYGALSPTCLFWPDVRVADGTPAGTSTVRGFGPNPFVPVLVERREGGAWFAITSEASEFELTGLPAGCYRVRALRQFGQQTFARGVYVQANGVAELRTNLYEHIDLEEPRSREVMGFVRWENGEPVKDAQVFMQDARDFRRFLQRVVADDHGYFHFANVPGDGEYFTFALPRDHPLAMKNFEYPQLTQEQREAWQDLTLHPHRVTGQVANRQTMSLQLVRVDGGGERVAWSFSSDDRGSFEVTNVPHGRYFVRSAQLRSKQGIRSRSC